MFETIARLKKDIANCGNYLDMTATTENKAKTYQKNIRELNEIITRLKRETSYICQFCGKKTTTPHGGTCRFSPYQNKTHKFIKAHVLKIIV